MKLLKLYNKFIKFKLYKSLPMTVEDAAVADKELQGCMDTELIFTACQMNKTQIGSTALVCEHCIFIKHGH